MGRLGVLAVGFVLAIGVAPRSQAAGLNFDFGNNCGLCAVQSFGAASGQSGDWNVIIAASTPSGIIDIDGNATGVAVEIAAGNLLGFASAPFPAGDLAALVQDNFFSSNGSLWSVSITGLADGIYDVYLYEPLSSAVGTGGGSVNGIGFANLNGNYNSATLIEGFNYHRLSSVPVSGGLLDASGSQPGNFSGLAGMQLVPLLTPIPEPSSALLLASGLTVFALRSSRSRRPGSRPAAQSRARPCHRPQVPVKTREPGLAELLIYLEPEAP